MGFSAVALHRAKNVTLYRQGGVNYLVSAEPGSFAADFAAIHGPSAAPWGSASSTPIGLPARHRNGRQAGVAHAGQTLNLPAIEGVGGAIIYFVDRYGDKGSIWDDAFDWSARPNPHPEGAGLPTIDHFTQTSSRPHGYWADFYQRIFNFRQIRFFDIEGELPDCFRVR